MAHYNDLIGHNTSPDRNNQIPSRLTALTPQNHPERPLLRGNQGVVIELRPQPLDTPSLCYHQGDSPKSSAKR